VFIKRTIKRSGGQTYVNHLLVQSVLTLLCCSEGREKKDRARLLDGAYLPNLPSSLVAAMAPRDAPARSGSDTVVLKGGPGVGSAGRAKAPRASRANPGTTSGTTSRIDLRAKAGENTPTVSRIRTGSHTGSAAGPQTREEAGGYASRADACTQSREDAGGYDEGTRAGTETGPENRVQIRSAASAAAGICAIGWTGRFPTTRPRS